MFIFILVYPANFNCSGPSIKLENVDQWSIFSLYAFLNNTNYIHFKLKRWAPKWTFIVEMPLDCTYQQRYCHSSLLMLELNV